MKSLFLTLSASLFLAQSAWAAVHPVDQLEQALKPSLAQLLKTETQRSIMDVDLDFKPRKKYSCERCGDFDLNLAKHIQRDTYMKVTLSFQNQQPVLKGQILTQAEKELLEKTVKSVLGQSLKSDLDVFPFDTVAKDYALTKEAGTNLYVKPVVKAGGNLATQVRLGTPLKVLAHSPDGKMALVRVEDDGYIAWVQRNALIEGNAKWFQTWKKERDVLVLGNLTQPEKLYFGTRLRLLEANSSTVKAQMPDGRTIQLPRSQVALSKAGKLPQAPAILKTARQYLPSGVQGKGHYLWGGTFGKRLDCSGFVQTVYRVNGVYLPRDADQQKGFTRSVGAKLNQISELQAGDLVFFSSHGKWPTHVGIYIGNNEFIHSSSKGPYNGIKISTLKGGNKYDAFLQKIYYGGGRGRPLAVIMSQKPSLSPVNTTLLEALEYLQTLIDISADGLLEALSTWCEEARISEGLVIQQLRALDAESLWYSPRLQMLIKEMNRSQDPAILNLAQALETELMETQGEA